MRAKTLHPWDLRYQDAMEIQRHLAKLVKESPLPLEELKLIAGVDVSSSRRSPIGFAAAVVMEYPTFKIVEVGSAKGLLNMPYIPGLLSFREAPLILRALSELKRDPQVILVDGNGVAHPRGLGIASHLGILLDWPTVGCAKSRLLGEHGEPGPFKGNWVPWSYKGKPIGAVVRTRERVKPVYISVGYRVTLRDAIHLVLKCCQKYRLPEPIRAAHREVNRLREEN